MRAMSVNLSFLLFVALLSCVLAHAPGRDGSSMTLPESATRPALTELPPSPPMHDTRAWKLWMQHAEELYLQQENEKSLELDLFSPTNKTCSKCNLIVSIAQWAVTSNTTIAEFEGIFETVCETSGHLNSTVCTKLATLTVDILQFAKHALSKYGYWDPTILCSFLSQCAVPCCSTNYGPEQIHLAVGYERISRIITWTTLLPTDCAVQIGTQPGVYNTVSNCSTTTYTSGGWVGQIHSVVVNDLLVDTTYYYRVGGSNGWSEQYSFNVWDDSDVNGFTIAFTGDMGARNMSIATRAFLNQATLANQIQGVIHYGDISYADGYERVFDEFFQELQPTMTTLPYMTCNGNHELIFNFIGYQLRFPMPQAPGSAVSDMYYSWDLGCIHFISLNGESIIDTAYMSPAQVAWLESDLKAFSARRAKSTPSATCSIENPSFVIVYMHRPLYCSNKDKGNCEWEAAYLESQVEDLFMQYGVSVVFHGHLHSYERTFPVYKSSVNPKGPVYIINGAGGNREGIERGWKDQPAWSASRLSVVGMGLMQILNGTTLQFSFFNHSDSIAPEKFNLQNAELLDQFYITSPVVDADEATPTEQVEIAQM